MHYLRLFVSITSKKGHFWKINMLFLQYYDG